MKIELNKIFYSYSNKERVWVYAKVIGSRKGNGEHDGRSGIIRNNFGKNICEYISEKLKKKI